MNRVRAFACSIALLAAACADRADTPPVVDVSGARYTGTWLDDGGSAAFLGLPFAEPPTDERRWRPPEPVAEPVGGSATEFAPACMQGPHMVDWYRDLVERFGGDPDLFPVPGFSEDCLYLNVWTPEPDPTAGLPVMVWIHGGGHKGGWSYEPNYVGDALARRGVVVVSIAYRVDVLGFFSHPDLEISNFGLLDQVRALEWVRDHIGAFGGDADNVTVFGESAGAASIGYLLAMPAARGLFRRAIHQSAGYEFIHRDRRADFLDEGEALAERVAGRGAGIAALRKAPAKALLDAAESVYADYQPNAVVDGDTLLEPPVATLERGLLGSVDLLIGSNADEWRMYLDEDTSEADVREWLAEHRPGEGEALLKILGDAPALSRLDRLVTARWYVCPSLQFADHVDDSGNRAWVYYFTRVRSGERAAKLGAYHGAEIPYVFGKHDGWLPTDELDRGLSETIADYWVSFARNGDPNGADRPAWPRYSAEDPAALEIGDTIDAAPHPERSLCVPGAGS